MMMYGVYMYVRRIYKWTKYTLWVKKTETILIAVNRQYIGWFDVTDDIYGHDMFAILWV